MPSGLDQHRWNRAVRWYRLLERLFIEAGTFDDVISLYHAALWSGSTDARLQFVTRVEGLKGRVLAAMRNRKELLTGPDDTQPYEPVR